MLHENLLRLSVILASVDISVKDRAEEIYEIRMAIDELLTDDEKRNISDRIKSKIQREAEKAFIDHNYWGAEYMATGSGKSKIAVDLCKDFSLKGLGKFLISVPTEKLRDENWHEEFKKWGAEEIWDEHVDRCCYASLNKYEGQHFDFVVLDEGHNATDNNVVKFFQQNSVDKCLLLTATKPKDLIKQQIFKNLKLNCVYELSLDEAVMLGIVAPYDITVVTMSLDSVDKYIKAGSKKAPFFTTEKGQYGYLSRLAFTSPNKMAFLNRMRFIYTLRSKTKVAKAILENVIPNDLRTLIFCGSKIQANELCEQRFYSKPSPPKKLPDNPTEAKQAKYDSDLIKYNEALINYNGDADLTLFKNGEINRLACVDALNEGHNIDNLDVGFIVQLNSSERDLVQRIGRLIRFRPGHRGKIIILCVEDTVDKEWVGKATINLESVVRIELSHLRAGLETIIF